MFQGRYAVDQLSRGEQFLEYVARPRPRMWLALDGDTNGWGEFAHSHLAATHPVRGLPDMNVFQRLDGALRRLKAD